MSKDLWGLPLSTESPRAAEQYVLGVEKLLSANVGAEEALGRAIDADSRFTLAHAARARVLQLRGAMPEARAAAARAVLLAPSALWALSARRGSMGSADRRLLNACVDAIVGPSRTTSQSRSWEFYGRRDRVRAPPPIPWVRRGTANKMSDCEGYHNRARCHSGLCACRRTVPLRRSRRRRCIASVSWGRRPQTRRKLACDRSSA